METLSVLNIVNTTNGKIKMIVTKWYRWNKETTAWDFNHYSEGLSVHNLPFGTYEQNKIWDRYDWKKQLATMIGSTIV